MTGRTTVRSRTIRGAILALGAVFALVSTAGPASAHHFENYSKERRHIKNRAREALGSPYRSGGSSPSGFDCSGMTRWAFLNHGASLPHSSQQQFDMGSSARGYRRIWNRSKLQRGDLVFFKTTSAQVGHVGIYIGRGKFISTTSSSGVRVDSVYDRYYWGPRWVGATRVPATMRYH